MRGYAAIGLFNPQKDINVGGVLRAVGCYDAAFVAIHGIEVFELDLGKMEDEGGIPQ